MKLKMFHQVTPNTYTPLSPFPFFNICKFFSPLQQGLQFIEVSYKLTSTSNHQEHDTESAFP